MKFGEPYWIRTNDTFLKREVLLQQGSLPLLNNLAQSYANLKSVHTLCAEKSVYDYDNGEKRQAVCANKKIISQTNL